MYQGVLTMIRKFQKGDIVRYDVDRELYKVDSYVNGRALYITKRNTWIMTYETKLTLFSRNGVDSNDIRFQSTETEQEITTPQPFHELKLSPIDLDTIFN